MATLDIRIDVTEIEALADRLVSLDTRQIGDAARRAVNKVGKASVDVVVSRLTRGINLTDEYVRERLYFEPSRAEATTVFRAEIVAPGPRSQNRNRVASGTVTSLRNYSPQQLMRPVRYSNDVIASKIGKLGPNPRKDGAFLPWKARIGDQMRGIPVGQKQAGVSVEVTRGQRKKIGLRNVFLMPLRRGKSLDRSRLGVFSRDPGDPKKAVQLRLGPSVYQLLNATAPALIADIQIDLRAAVLDEVGKVVREALT
jgi:hypothetical protein